MSWIMILTFFIQETWLYISANNHVTAAVCNFGYKLHHVMREDTSKRTGGGVGILCKNIYHLPKMKLKVFTLFEHCMYILQKSQLSPPLGGAQSNFTFSNFVQSFPN